MSDEPNRKHLFLWGKIPDEIDDAHKKAETIFQSLINKSIQQSKTSTGYFKAAWNDSSQSRIVNVLRGYGSSYAGSAYIAGALAGNTANSIAKLSFGTPNFDLLRLGDSLLNPSAENIVKDVLRALNLLPLVGRVGVAVKEVMLVTQEAGKMTCVLVSLNNALVKTGRIFVNVFEVARARGLLKTIAKDGTSLENVIKLKTALTEMGAAIEEIQKPLERLEAGIEVLEDIAKENPKGVLVIPIECGRILAGGRREFGHAITGQFIPGKGIVFTDTNGQVLKGVAELRRQFPPNLIISEGYPILFLKNTWLVQTFKSPILNIWFPAANWGLTQQQSLSDKHSFIGPPRGTAVADREPLGMG